MSFRDFIMNRLYRRWINARFERYKNIQPPANPSRRYIDKLVRRLLNHRTAWDARKELELIGSAAAPSLAEALNDTRFHLADWDHVVIPAPLDCVLELLAPHNAARVYEFSATLVEAPSGRARRLAAHYLAESGRDAAMPQILKLLNDPDGYVRCSVASGLQTAASAYSEKFRRTMFEVLLEQSEQNWGSSDNEAPVAVVALDPMRAATEYSSTRWLSTACRNALNILRACNGAGVILQQSAVEQFLAESLRKAEAENCYPHDYAAAEALTMLVIASREQARPQLSACLSHSSPKVREAAAKGLARLAGLGDPYEFVLNHREKAGDSGLTEPQRIIYLVTVFDGEVCNGGLMQFFGNSSGNRAGDTLAALKQFQYEPGLQVLEVAIEVVGSAALESDQERRLSAIGRRYDELQKAFEPLETEYYRSKDRLREKILLYTIDHADHFRDGAT